VSATGATEPGDAPRGRGYSYNDKLVELGGLEPPAPARKIRADCRMPSLTWA
jgi:hypothetical protein